MLFRRFSRWPMAATTFADNMLTWGRNNVDARRCCVHGRVAEQHRRPGRRGDRLAPLRAGLRPRTTCVQLDGDFVECGAYTGVGMKTVIDYLGGTEFPRTFWGYDIFEHDAAMLNHAMPEHGEGLYERVLAKFAGL